MQEKNVQHYSAIKKQWSTIVSLSKVILLISMVELDQQRSAAKTLVNKMGLDTFVLYNIILIIAGLRHILSLYFTVLIHFDEYKICVFFASEIN